MLLNENFLLNTETARKLFHRYAEGMPIIDYHCHLNPKEIYDNKYFTNLSRAWINDGLYGDHYKWRLMRANGVPEQLITGNGDDEKKLIAWAGTIEKAIGNPLYEWTHLELKRFFDIDDVFSRHSAPAVWEKANALLATDDFKPRRLIQRMNVKAVCTTDDPADDLHYHELLKKEEKENGFKVIPAFRPDKVLSINTPGFNSYLENLGKAANVSIDSFDHLIEAMKKRISFFHEVGCRLSDHGLNTFTFHKVSRSQLNSLFDKALIGRDPLNEEETAAYQTALLEALMTRYHELNWTMQIHMNVIRNANTPMFAKLGPDTGFDSVGFQSDIAGQIMNLLMNAEQTDSIPKMILYSLNDNDWMTLATGMQSFQKQGVQKLQLGGAWWFNDTADGMEKQLKIMAQQSLLANFVGMLTDSRSFLSYPRHEYFRRVLCRVIGTWVEDGRLPDDQSYIGKIVENIAYRNAYNYFGFFSKDKE
ncbi:glucuronate isomerase [Sporolactobacillus shoreicorticis]|uniref:Uronate isomerase n=1 Tax=Sporolactobacillus shoreicorticis TaxID=1923877 RepID=A0ABW5S0V1_9BACL|nr:glucuronate isomerase [Sporolactobacillus shoreicorticis]MCO7124720.1 glucuronate isomerase [Sporolactobacillus shoreicorticis]